MKDATMCNVWLANISYPAARELGDLILFTWFGLCLAAFIISLVSFRRRGLVGFCWGLLCMLGAALCFFFNFGVWVALDDPLGPFQRDSLLLNGLGTTGLALFFLGARLGLRRKLTQ